MTYRQLIGPGGATEARQVEHLTALSDVLAQLQALVVTGTVALDPATLAALEQVVVSGTVTLGAPVELAGPVDLAGPVELVGPVALDAATLAALETIQATVTNLPSTYPDPDTTTAVDTLRTALVPLLEQILDGPLTITGDVTVTGPVAVTGALDVTGAVEVTNQPTEFPLPADQLDQLTPPETVTIGAPVPGQATADGQAAVLVLVDLLRTELAAALAPLATEVLTRALTLEVDSVRQTLRTSTPVSTAVTGPVVDQVLVNVAAAQRIRLLRNAGHVDPALSAETYPLVTVKIGATTIYRDKLEAGLPWSETVCFEGAPGEDLTISVDAAATVYLNMRYELVDVTP